mmetsp:Transcript_72396/g.143536  ORF Transcript_72396/g.143536 Transcript_72396/m.143536 type:complete len:90 (-) Transcript_72396:830-1099(-)
MLGMSSCHLCLPLVPKPLKVWGGQQPLRRDCRGEVLGNGCRRLETHNYHSDIVDRSSRRCSGHQMAPWCLACHLALVPGNGCKQFYEES